MAKVRNCFKSGKKSPALKMIYDQMSFEKQPIICLLEPTFSATLLHTLFQTEKLRSHGIFSWLFSNPLQFLCTDLDHCEADRCQTQLCIENLWPRDHRYCYIVENNVFAFERRILVFFLLCFGGLLFDGTKRFQIVHHDMKETRQCCFG